MSEAKQAAILSLESKFAAKDAAKAEASVPEETVDNSEEEAEIVKPAEGTKPDAPAAPADDSEEEEHDEESATSDNGDDPTARPKKNKGVGKRINELTREKHEALRRAEAVEAENAYFRQLVQQQQQGQPPSQQQTPTQAQGKPTLEAYGWDQEAFAEALTDWKVDQRFQALQQESQQRQYQDKEQERAKKANEQIQALEQKMPGAWDRISHAPIDYKPPMVEFIKDSDIGLDMGLYLADHLDEASQISRMSPFGQVRAMGRLEERLQSRPSPQKPVTVTRAPAPAPGLPAGTSATAKMDSMEDHIQAVRAKRKALRYQG
jgi:hypothetical protein